MDIKKIFDKLFYTYMYGDWDSLNKWAWIYIHISIIFITFLCGYTFATGSYIQSIILILFPILFIYRRYTYARPN